MVIGIDFDGTCVTHDFPYIGEDIGAIPVLMELVEKGHQLILYTMRSNMKTQKHNSPGPEGIDTNYLDLAVNWFKMNKIPLYGIQENPQQKGWTESPKPHAQMYIDDLGLGAPLKYDVSLSNYPFIDWIKVKSMLISQKIL